MRGVCRACGCTETTPCPNGCAWVPDTAQTLCTACLDGRWRIDGADTGAVVLVNRQSGYRRHYGSAREAAYAAIRLTKGRYA